MAFDVLICNIFVPQKVPLSKISDDIIACDLLPPSMKNPGYAYVMHYSTLINKRQLLIQQELIVSLDSPIKFRKALFYW